MSTTSSPARPKGRASIYLYAIGAASTPVPEALKGLDDAPVERLDCGTLAAFVSTTTIPRLRPERRHLAAHQSVVQALTAQHSVLPVSFGVMLSSKIKLQRLIENEADALREQFEHIDGRVEMTLRVSWDVENIFQFFVEREPDLRAARDAMLRPGATHNAKVAAGELFGKLLSLRRTEHQNRVTAALEPVAAEIAIEAPRTDHEVLRLAALVDRATLPAFESRVHQIAEGFDASYRFDFSGPWAPHSFVRLELDPGELAEAS